ncbi:MAG: RIP metalloprotease RseP [Planctomycetes bacterium]|nr:RIP metalloprotease RseP [Planctomycetota bacterium]MBI3833550.1 RIP metalloprotease RseP [Planctomycetota bacterium]
MHSLLTVITPHSGPQSLLAMALPPAIGTAWDHIWPYLVMILGFSIIVFVHELGHFAVAKWAGVRVERFAIGFGRELFGYTYGETRYSFNMLPLGGYVKMLGQEDFDDKTNEWKFKEDPRSFANKPVGARMAIVSAGVIMNILFSCLLFMIVFHVGVEAVAPRIAYIEADSPAEKAGLLPGDIIHKINGEKVLEFQEIKFGVMLAPPHEPIELQVERHGEMIPPIYVTPKYNRAEATRDMQRQIIGIAQGVTREIIGVGPEIDASKPDSPHVGDVIVEVGGMEATDDNASEILGQLPYVDGDVIVERKDADHPDARPKRVKIRIPPLLTIYPSDSSDLATINVLGLAPLTRVAAVDPRGRAALAGLEAGDTILLWNDVPHPSIASVSRATRDNPNWDMYYRVRKADGRIVQGFVRPSMLQHGAPTLQAVIKPITGQADAKDRGRTIFESVRRDGAAFRSGISDGDVILQCDGTENPTVADVNAIIQGKQNESVLFVVRKPNGPILRTNVMPVVPGTIDANCSLVADDVVEVSDIIANTDGQRTPAADAGIPAGALIESISGEAVHTWRELIAQFRSAAGGSVKLALVAPDGKKQQVNFRVPNCLRTILGVGPEARILKIDGRDSVMIETGAGKENVSVRYHEGTEAILRELVGHKAVPVEYRASPFASVQTKTVDITSDMTDTWLGRIQLSANIGVRDETTILKGEGVIDCVRIGIHKTYYFMFQVYKTMQRMFFTRTVGFEGVSGPLGIMDMGGQVARMGVIKFLFFMAIISANLAVINFLPLPIVDGGLMVFLMIEKLKGSPVSLKVQVATQMIGLALIFCVFLLVTYQDAMKLWG